MIVVALRVIGSIVLVSAVYLHSEWTLKGHCCCRCVLLWVSCPASASRAYPSLSMLVVTSTVQWIPHTLLLFQTALSRPYGYHRIIITVVIVVVVFILPSRVGLGLVSWRIGVDLTGAWDDGAKAWGLQLTTPVRVVVQRGWFFFAGKYMVMLNRVPALIAVSMAPLSL